jgi:hypothetical protein
MWPSRSQSAVTLPLSTTRSPRSLSKDPARRAATLARDLCPDLGILTKADRAWRQTQGATWWYTRHHTATVPSHHTKLAMAIICS